MTTLKFSDLKLEKSPAEADEFIQSIIDRLNMLIERKGVDRLNSTRKNQMFAINYACENTVLGKSLYMALSYADESQEKVLSVLKG